ncbi:MAG: hypothetical protein ACM3ML_04100 [Micromonosporaceae bacterium]
MSASARTRYRLRHLIALIVGVAFLAGAAAVLGAYVNRSGIDGYAAFGFAVVVADVWVLARALSRAPYRRGAPWLLLRLLAGGLLLVGPVLLVIFGYAPIFVSAAKGTTNTPDRTLLVAAGLLLIPVIACAAAVAGKRSIKDEAGHEA